MKIKVSLPEKDIKNQSHTSCEQTLSSDLQVDRLMISYVDKLKKRLVDSPLVIRITLGYTSQRILKKSHVADRIG